MARRDKPLLRSQIATKRRQRWFVIKCVAAGLLALAALIFASWLSKQPRFLIKNVQVSGTSFIASDDVVNLVKPLLEGNYVYLFARANALLYPKGQIIAAIKASSQRIDAVDVSRGDWQTLTVTLHERQPVAVWCGLDHSVANDCYVFDKHAWIFAPAPDFSGTAYVRWYGPMSSSTPITATFLDQATFDHLGGILQSLSTIGLEPFSVVVGDRDVTVYLKNDAQLIFSKNDSADHITIVLNSLFNQKVFAASRAADFSNLSYIDMRFGNKVFYKLSSSTADTASSTFGL